METVLVYHYGAFEAGDKDDLLETIDDIEKLTAKLRKKREQRRPTKTEERELQHATKELLQKAVEITRRQQPEAERDYAKAELGTDSMIALRSLFRFLDDRNDAEFNVDLFQEQITTFVSHFLTIDGGDISATETKESPDVLDNEEEADEKTALPDEEGSDFPCMVDVVKSLANHSTAVLGLISQVDWNSPSPSESSDNDEDEVKIKEETLERVTKL